MPSLLLGSATESVNLASSDDSPYEPPHPISQEKYSLHLPKNPGTLANGYAIEGSGAGKRVIDEVFVSGPNVMNPSLQSLPNGRSSGSIDSRDRLQSKNDGSFSMKSRPGSLGENERQGPVQAYGTPKHGTMEQGNSQAQGNRDTVQIAHPITLESNQSGATHRIGHMRAHSASEPQRHFPPSAYSSHADSSATSIDVHTTSQEPQSLNRFSSPPNFSNSAVAASASSISSVPPGPPRLQHRHTLQVPKVPAIRNSRDFSSPVTSASNDTSGETERFSPTAHGLSRISSSLGRRPTRSIHSDMYLDEIPHDGDTARWTETIRQKRASRRHRKEEEEDDRVVVGTKVDMNHVNWVTAYNMLTGIRFTVSRTNAKIDRDLTDADFDAKHKFSFDITGNELTPSAKYDFKFKDYAPWVFRHLRSRFMLDPADYLMSLTSKYILSELGSPGKSGSFFYFSRDYKYIIKTIHHAEHKLLRKILRDYYTHMELNPNSLISQFYGLHRVKIPYGRKIHFVVMNNLFPPHRDIHQTFDLKGSTIGRDFKEEDLERNPRATLKDLNWLRRNYHFEFGDSKKRIFIEQMEKDVALLRKLKIMDYSLLVGIHDMSKGNEENLRDKTLQVFHPGGEHNAEPQPNMLLRTASKLENQRKAKELRQIIKREKPVPMDKSTSALPDEILEERKDFVFYSDDGGFRATHEDGEPGEEIYYLGIIDCLTHYGFIKKAEHMWKGLSNNKSQISPIPPEGYGDRFVKFITGLTMTREEAERGTLSGEHREGSGSINRQVTRTSTEKVMNKAVHQAQKTVKHGATENPTHDKTLGTIRGPSIDKSSNSVAGATLPVVEEAGEAGSREDSMHNEKQGVPLPHQETISAGAYVPPPTPLNDRPRIQDEPFQGPKKDPLPPTNKELPSIPQLSRFSMTSALGGSS